jgi:hypothetical protein
MEAEHQSRRDEARNQTATRPKPRAHSPRGGIAEMRAQLHRDEVLFNVSRRVWQKDTLEDVFDSLVEITSQELHCERSSYLLNDPRTGELYSKAAQGSFRNEIRFANTLGVDGAVFKSGIAAIVDDAYADPRFNPEIDQDLGFTTRNILAVPLRAADGVIFGVAQCLNKIGGNFTDADRALLEDIAGQAIPALRSSQFIERMNVARAKGLCTKSGFCTKITNPAHKSPAGRGSIPQLIAARKAVTIQAAPPTREIRQSSFAPAPERRCLAPDAWQV